MRYIHEAEHEFKGSEINDLQKWRRGWDTQSCLGTILSCLQQHARKPHGYWRFPWSRLLQLFLPFRMNSTNFALKQTPKTPNQKAHECDGQMLVEDRAVSQNWIEMLYKSAVLVASAA